MDKFPGQKASSKHSAHTVSVELVQGESMYIPGAHVCVQLLITLSPVQNLFLGQRTHSLLVVLVQVVFS